MLPLHDDVAADNLSAASAAWTAVTVASDASGSIMTSLAGNVSERYDVAALIRDCVVLDVSEALALQEQVSEAGISADLEEIMDWVVACIFGNIFFSVSLPTNVINMIVFYKLGLRERINLCLFSMSLADLVFMTTSFVLYIDRAPRLVLGLSRWGSPVFGFMMNNHLTTLYGCSRVSAFISTLIACERCFCVVSPLKAKRLLSTRTMFWVIVVGSTLILIVEYISDLRGSVVCVYNPLTNVATMDLYPGPLFLKNQQFIETMEAIVFGFFMPVCFFCLTILTTIITIVRLRQMASWREKTVLPQTTTKASSASAVSRRRLKTAITAMKRGAEPEDESIIPSSSEASSGDGSHASDSDHSSNVRGKTLTSVAPMSSRDAALTRMLIANSILFIVCMSPYFGVNAILPFMPQLSANQTLFAFMVSVYELGGYINATFNFFIYYTMGTRFRETLQGMCRCCRSKSSK